MPFAGFHGLDLIVILAIALLIFGPKKLPEMGSAIGKSISSFKKGMSELTEPKEEKPADFEAIEKEIATNGYSLPTSEVTSETSAAEHTEHTEPSDAESSIKK